MDLIFLAISTVIFWIGSVIAWRSLISGQGASGGLNLAIAAAGFLFQCLFLQQRGELHHRCPITNGPEVLVFVGWSTVMLYLILGRAFRLSLLGVFSMPLVAIFQSIATVLLLINDPGPRPTETLDPWLEMHAAMSLLAYGAFGLSCIAGIMYLVQDGKLKRRQTGGIFRQLPPIRYLSDAMIRLLMIGLLLLTLGIISAFFMQATATPIHLLVLGAVWLAYAVILSLHFLHRLAAKRCSLVMIGAFVFAVITLAVL
ncbi:MAG: cytochrome c biogenesis protein CcsA [Verrucomicrobiota bacterium]